MVAQFGKEVALKKMLKLLELDAVQNTRAEKFQKILARKHVQVNCLLTPYDSYGMSHAMLNSYLATKCNNHLTMVDLTKMTAESAPDDTDSIKTEEANPQNQPNPLVLPSGPADSPAGVTIKPSTSGDNFLQVSFCTSIFLAITILFV